MFTRLLICQLVFCSWMLLAQSASISGSVINAGGTPIAGISVLVKGNNNGYITNSDGVFRINGLNPGVYTLQFSGIGYATQYVSANLMTSQKAELKITLEEKATELSVMEVIGKTDAQIIKEQSVKAEVIDLKPAQMEATTLTESMNRAAGVRVRQTGGLGSQASVFVNGFTGKAVKFFKDDIPLDYLGEGFNLTLLPINMLDRVEIYKGVLPSKLGADALGGAVNYVTKSSVKNYLDASYEVASYNTHRASLNVYQSSVSNRFFYGVDGFFNHSDNNYKVIAKVVDNETATRLPREVKRFHDGFTNGYAEVYAGVKNTNWADEMRVNLSGFNTRREVQNDAIMTNPFGEIVTKQNGFVSSLRYKKSFANSRFTVDQFLVYSKIKSRVIDTCSCQYDWYGNRTAIPARNGEADADGSLSNVDFNNTTSRTYLSYQLTPNIKLEFNNVISDFTRIGSDPFGTVYFSSKRDILSVPAGYTKWVSALGLETHFFHEKLSNSMAIKRYFYKTHGTDGAFASYNENQVINKNENYGVADAIKFNINENSFIRSSVELASRLPEQGEVFGDAQFLLSNFTLKPERSTNINLGYRFEKSRRVSIEPNLFYRITKDQIILVPEGLIYLQYQNVEQTKGYGIDLDFNFFPVKWLQLFGNATYQELRLFGLTSIADRFLEGARLRNTPYFFGNTGIRTDFKNKLMPKDAIRLFWYFSYTHEYYLSYIPRSQEAKNLWSSPSISTDLIIPTQNLHSAGVNYSINNDKVSFGLEVKNMFNAQLFDNFRVQRAGRSYHFKIRYLIN